MEIEAAKKKKKDWIQKADVKSGKFGAWCKKHGFKEGVCQSCINKAISTGGSAAKMANFAINTSQGKYKHPKKKKKKAEIINKLVKLADVLDEKGLTAEAVELDTIIQESVADKTYESIAEPVTEQELVQAEAEIEKELQG